MQLVLHVTRLIVECLLYLSKHYDLNSADAVMKYSVYWYQMNPIGRASSGW